MRVLVTGGAGFIGTHLCEWLLNTGNEVFSLDNMLTGRQRNVTRLSDMPGFTSVEHDLIYGLPVLPKFDQIYHLASPASPIAYQRYGLETLRVNSEGTFHVLELAARTGARFMLASTSEVYGDPLVHPQPESYRGNVSTTGPRAMYDEAKRYAEALTSTFREREVADTRIVRIFNTFGPYMSRNDGRVISNFIVQALERKPLTIYGSGQQTRSFQYVSDLIDGMTLLMNSSIEEPVNIGNPQERTITDLANLILEMTGSTSEIVYHDLPGDDPTQRCPDISMAIAELGWQPQVSIRDGLDWTIQYFSETALATPVIDAATLAGSRQL